MFLFSKYIHLKSSSKTWPMRTIFLLLLTFQWIPRQPKHEITNLNAFPYSHETNQKYLMVLGGTSTTCQFVFSETMRKRGLLFQTSKEWGYTPVYGMRTTGQLEVGLSRLTGIVHLSLPDSVGLGQKLASGMGQWVSINVPPDPQQTGGLPQLTASWAVVRWVRWSGSEIISWSTTTAKILKDSMDKCLLNVLNRSSNPYSHFFSYCINQKIILLHSAFHCFFPLIFDWANFVRFIVFQLYCSFFLFPFIQ